MNISYKWLKRYINFDLDPRQLAAALTSLGLESDHVEEVESVKGGLRGLVIGEVLTCEPHPDSDHLHITTVDLGNGEPVQIVCGAPNVDAGQKVVVATIGTVLYADDKEFKIKKSKIRGVESFGMICAEDEIGLGASHDGIMVLPAEAEAGTPAAEYFNIESDYMVEVELTPNRVDAASHYGTARDLKAWLAACSFKQDPQAPMPQIFTPDVNEFAPDREGDAAQVEVVDKQGAPRYSGVTVRGVEVRESPEWLKNLLVAAGQRPINNIVDITNFILLGIGQPLHCFDLAKVSGGKIVVRTCKEGTPFTTLDGVEHKLSDADLMICDEEKPLCIAGVFGGLDSGVTESTKDVFIESAWFNPTRIRKTARRQGLSTDASFRYERGTDPLITVYAAKLAALLIKEVAGGEICGDVVDICSEHPGFFPVELSIDYCNKLIGKEIPLPLIKRILESLEIRILPQSTGSMLKLEVPPYRVDVTRPCDVVEEILRVYGYNNVEFGTEMHANLSQKGLTDLSFELQNSVSEQLSARGFREILNNSLTASSYYEDNDKYPAAECVKLMNPLSSDLMLMRRTLLYGGLESIAHNVNRKASDLRFYEFGNVYHLDPSAEITVEKPLAPFSEELHLALWLTGNYAAQSWNSTPTEADFFTLKGILLNVLRRLGVESSLVMTEQESDSHFSAKLNIRTRGGKPVGEIGILSRSLLKKFDIKQSVIFAELCWDRLLKLAAKTDVTFVPLPRTQPVRRDLALLLDSDVTFARVQDVIARSERKLLRSVSLFDVYEGEHLPAGKKSYAVALILQDDEKTLQDKQIDAVMKKVVANLQRELGAELR